MLPQILIGFGFGSMGKREESRLEREYREIKRKIFHMLSGVFIFVVSYFFGRFWGVVSIIFSAFATFLLPFFKFPLVGEAIEEMYKARGERPAEGAFNFSIGSILPILIGQPWIVLALGLGDGISTLIGKFFGRTKIYKDKTLEGCIAEFLVVMAIAKYFFPNPIIPALLYTIVELTSPVDDNLTIPIVLSFLYFPWF